VAGSLRIRYGKAQTMIAPVRIDDALSTLKGIFLEIPRLELNIEQACELTGLDRRTCGVLLTGLEQARFLWQSEDGRFVLRPDWKTIES
jgi:DNA-binding IclR family transcriptional regulator